MSRFSVGLSTPRASSFQIDYYTQPAVVFDLTSEVDVMSRKRMLFITVWVGIAASLSLAEFQRDESHLESRILGVLLVSAVVMLGLYLGSQWLVNRKARQGESKKSEGKNTWAPVFLVVLLGGLFLLLVCVSYLRSSQPATTQPNVANQAPQNALPQNATPQATPKRLTREQLIEDLKAQGQDPSKYDLDAYLRSQEEIPSNTPSFPSNVHYMITVTDATGHQDSYFSEKEPKPYGNGYKFKMYGTGIELTVSGNVQIMRVQ